MILRLYLPAFMLALANGLVVPVLPVLVKTQFEVAFATAALATTAAVVGSAAATLPVGSALDRLDRRLVAALGPSLVALAAMRVPFSGSFTELLVWQFLCGWGSQTWMLGRLAVLGDIGDPARLGRQMTTMIGCETLGRVLGPVLGGALATSVGLQAPFWMQCAICALIAVALLWARRRSGRCDATPLLPRARLIELLRNGPLRRLLPVQALVALTRGALLAGVVDLYIVYAYDLNAAELGTLRSATLLACVPVTFIAGLVMDRFGRRATLIPGFMALVVCFTSMSAIAWHQGGFVAFVAAYVAATMSAYFTGGAMQTLGIDAAPPAFRGRYLGLLRLAADGGSASSCLGFALLATALGHGFAFLVLALSGAAVTALIVRWIEEPKRRG